MPFHGDLDRLLSAADSLRALARKPGDELILAVNTPGLKPNGAAAGIHVVAADERLSAYLARNRGAAKANNDWLLFLDADCEPPPALLDSYFAAGPKPDAGLLAGEVEGSPRQRGLLARWARSRRGAMAARFALDPEMPAGITGNLLVRRSTFERVGGFDAGVRSGADLDFCWRASEAGERLAYVPGASVCHRDPERLRPVLRQAYRYGTGRRWLIDRHRVVDRPRLIRPIARALAVLAVRIVTLDWEASKFKLLDICSAAATWAGYRFGSNASA